MGGVAQEAGVSEHDRSMGILQQADEERARRKDNPGTWEERKARLERRVNVWPTNYDDAMQLSKRTGASYSWLWREIERHCPPARLA